MRPKFVLVLTLFTALVLGVALFLKQHVGSPVLTPASPDLTIAAPAAASNVEAAVTWQPAIKPLSIAPAVSNAITDEDRQAAVDAEIDRLQQWSMNDDSVSLANILADLTNPDKEVREAAIAAAKEFGNQDAIPALKAAADKTEDLPEKIELLEAADFLTLPSVTFDSPPVVKTPEAIQADELKHARRHPPIQNPPAVSGN